MANQKMRTVPNPPATIVVYPVRLSHDAWCYIEDAHSVQDRLGAICAMQLLTSFLGITTGRKSKVAWPQRKGSLDMEHLQHVSSVYSAVDMCVCVCSFQGTLFRWAYREPSESTILRVPLNSTHPIVPKMARAVARFGLGTGNETHAVCHLATSRCPAQLTAGFSSEPNCWPGLLLKELVIKDPENMA